MAKFTPEEIEELACSYAALILHDEGLPISADKITALARAAGIQIEPFWPAAFKRAFGEGDIIGGLILNAGAAPVAAPAAGAAPAAAGAAAVKEEEKKEEKKKEEEKEEEDEDVDLGFGLFD